MRTSTRSTLSSIRHAPVALSRSSTLLPGKKVVLGLVTTKAAELEDEDVIVERIHEAAKYVPLENLYLSPQCGFASCEIGNKLTEDEQWAKIALVKRIAERVWK